MAAIDSSNQLKQDIQVIEQNVRQLEKKYTDYFDGKIAREPKELRTQTESLVLRWWGKPIANTMLRFQFNSLVQRWKTYKEKWDRLLRVKEKNEREELIPE
jgi:hypothetical protein